ncbi:MAG: right-handed parallel beta-helix repeat-containing protein, partial [Myxococcota bacterium]|nr:right-handed parallel beta-helix repeat-containing protein [Myxococcota bacterium]
GGSGGSSVTDSVLEDAPLFGVLLVDQDAVVSGNTVVATDPGEETVGIAVGGDNGDFEVRDNQVSGYGLMGIWVQYPFGGSTPIGGTAAVTGNTVTDVALYGVLATGLDEAEVADNLIQGITWGGELSNGGYPDGFGLSLWDIGELAMSGNEVLDVDVVGIYVQESTFVSLDDQVSETGMWGILVSESSGTFERLLVNNTSVCGADVRTSSVEFVEAVFRNVQQGVPPEYWEDGWPVYYYAHGALFSDSQCSFVDSWFLDNQDYPLSINDTDVRVEGTTFRGASSYGVYSVYGFGEIRDSLFEDMTYAIHLDSSDEASQIGDLTVADNQFTGVYSALYSQALAGTTVFEGNQVDAVTGYGLYLTDTVADGAWIEVRDNSFSDLANSAVYASGVELEMVGANAVDGVQNGHSSIYLQQVTGMVSGLAVTDASGPGLTADSSDVTITGCQLVGSAGHNLELRDSTVQVLDNLALSQGGSAGIKLEGAVQGSITGNLIQDNGAYGIHCDSPDVALDTCDNTMGGNTPADLHEENGCSLSCTW